jgi:leucyl aminopeptidase
MNITIVKGDSKLNQSKCLVIPINQKGIPKDILNLNSSITESINSYVNTFSTYYDIGAIHLINNSNQSILLVGTGASEAIGRSDLKVIISKLDAHISNLKHKTVTNLLLYAKLKGLKSDTAVQSLTEAINYSAYRFDQLKTKVKSAMKVKKYEIVVPPQFDSKIAREGLKLGKAISNGVSFARDLANLPANICTPAYLADQAKVIAQSNNKFSIKILEAKDMEKLKMGGILSVTKGSDLPPKFIILNYKGDNKNAAPTIFCGKGITFDTGGISLKPPSRMDEMKFDMCGAASVLGAARSIAEFNPNINFMVIVPTCENMASGKATRPGDVITTYSGQTVEVLNTDAEGRMILCDALSYSLQFKPKAIVDVATLTGACVVALGTIHSGLFSNDTSLIGKLKESADKSGDSVWHMPIDDAYGDGMKSNFADFANIGSSRDAGASIAAQFLSRFVDKTPWAHLDIAGTAHNTGAQKFATGRPVSLLVEFLINIKR